MTSFSAPALSSAPRIRPGLAPADLGAILVRIEEAIEAETAGIRSDMNFDLAASNARKSRHLYDLTRAIRGQEDAALVASFRPQIESLRDKLAVNQGVIVAHLEAVTEVATLVKTALQDAEADGTYSQAEFPEAKRG